jgi:hypothetical protein
VEEAKVEKEHGLYLHPELFGTPMEKSIVTARRPGAIKMMKEAKAKLTDSNNQ